MLQRSTDMPVVRVSLPEKPMRLSLGVSGMFTKRLGESASWERNCSIRSIPGDPGNASHSLAKKEPADRHSTAHHLDNSRNLVIDGESNGLGPQKRGV